MTTVQTQDNYMARAWLSEVLLVLTSKPQLFSKLIHRIIERALGCMGALRFGDFFHILMGDNVPKSERDI